MTLKQNKKKVMSLLEQLDWMFSVQNFDRSVIFSKDDEYLDDTPVHCRITYEEDYQRVAIEIFPTFFKMPLDEQRKTILHELIHTITIPLNKIAFALHAGNLYTPYQIKQSHERATSRMENIVDKLLRGNMKYAKKAYEDYLKPITTPK